MVSDDDRNYVKPPPADMSFGEKLREGGKKLPSYSVVTISC